MGKNSRENKIETWNFFIKMDKSIFLWFQNEINEQEKEAAARSWWWGSWWWGSFFLSQEALSFQCLISTYCVLRSYPPFAWMEMTYSLDGKRMNPEQSWLILYCLTFFSWLRYYELWMDIIHTVFVPKGLNFHIISTRNMQKQGHEHCYSRTSKWQLPWKGKKICKNAIFFSPLLLRF